MSEILKTILAGLPAFRRRQVEHAWFEKNIHRYEDITTLSKDLRAQLAGLPWLGVESSVLQRSKIDDTQKALLKLFDGEMIETVLMGRQSKKQNDAEATRQTVCVSTQVGCPMRCVFCSTGKLGFKRNLTAEEIIDQVRFWWAENQISNIVLMGQGEPLLNYDNVKEVINVILQNTEIGPRQITVSTAGVPAAMEKMLADKDWPPVRFALSLHNAVENERAQIMPSHQPDFLNFLVDWATRYHARFSSRVQFIGLEYIFLAGINDSAKHLRALKTLASKLGKVRINLIPYNSGGCPGELVGSDEKIVKEWHEALMAAGFTATIRHSQGQDIAAACGQLRNKY